LATVSDAAVTVQQSVARIQWKPETVYSGVMDQEQPELPGVYKKRFEVERILDHHIALGHLFVLVKWLGYDDPADLTWEPIAHMTRCPRKLVEYQQRLPPFSVVPPPDPT
jgi:hypothetical protein